MNRCFNKHFPVIGEIGIISGDVQVRAVAIWSLISKWHWWVLFRWWQRHMSTCNMPIAKFLLFDSHLHHLLSVCMHLCNIVTCTHPIWLWWSACLAAATCTADALLGFSNLARWLHWAGSYAAVRCQFSSLVRCMSSNYKISLGFHRHKTFVDKIRDSSYERRLQLENKTSYW